MKKEIDVYYDEEGDYLEIHIGEYTEDYGEEREDFIFECIDEKTKEVVGIGIFEFKQRVKDNEVKLEYNQEEDTMHFSFYPQANNKADKTVKISDEVTFTYYKKNIRSILLLNASKHLPKKIMEEALMLGTQ